MEILPCWSHSILTSSNYLTPLDHFPSPSKQDAKADVILRYSPDEARSLKAYCELPESAKINETNFDEESGDEIDFADVSDEEDAIDEI